MALAAPSPIAEQLRSLCGSDLNIESTRALLLSLSPEAKLHELNIQVITLSL